MNDVKSDLVFPYGQAKCSGSIKLQVDDFKVVEQLGFDFTGAGEHLFLYIQKTGLTTHELINLIAEKLSVPARQIGYSGLKDKHAITRQWLSVQLPGCKQIPDITETDQFQILQTHWHDRKLRVGVHKSNQFDIKVRNVTGNDSQLSSTIESIRCYGFANYFGEQRFGARGDNVEQALRILNNRHKSKRMTRTKRSLLISSLRSELYNRILSKRISREIWQQPIDGDVFVLAGSQSVFAESLSSEINRRYREFDIHSGVSLFGTGDSRLSLSAMDIENEIFAANAEICETLLNQNLKRSFRANRAVTKNLEVQYFPEQAEIHIQVELKKGSYLTTLLNHFVSLT